MNQRLHPYALIIGTGIGIMVFAAIRHPLFSIFATVVAIILIDMAYKASNRNDP